MIKHLKELFSLILFAGVILGYNTGCNHSSNEVKDKVASTDSSKTISDNNNFEDDCFKNFDTVFTGQELFRRSCAGCHRLNREGASPRFPSLVYIKDKMSRDEIHEQILMGKGLMISHSHLPENEIHAIIAYLYDDPDQKVVVENYNKYTLGKNIVLSNCVSCHRLNASDPEPRGAKKLCPDIDPSVLLEGIHNLNKEQFSLILKTGPCYMPSFDYMNQSDKDAIWAFLHESDLKGGSLDSLDVR